MAGRKTGAGRRPRLVTLTYHSWVNDRQMSATVDDRKGERVKVLCGPYKGLRGTCTGTGPFEYLIVGDDGQLYSLRHSDVTEDV